VIVRGLFYSTAFVLTWAWLAISVRRFDEQLPVSVPSWLGPVGPFAAVTGATVVAWCIGTFITRGRGTPAPFDPPRRFVATGPYRFVRNPMYIGGFFVLLGVGLAVQSAAITALGLVFVLLAHVLVVLYEEPALSRRFGESYRQYRSSVGRWLPRTAYSKGTGTVG